MNTAIGLSTTRDFKRGDRMVTARELQALKRAARVGASVNLGARGVHAIVDQDGVHQRQVTQETTADLPFFWGVVMSVSHREGYAMVKRASGRLGQLQPINESEPAIMVWIGFETHFRPPSSGTYDEIFCMPNPDNVDASYRWFGVANMPGYAYKEPTFGYSAVQDDPPLET